MKTKVTKTKNNKNKKKLIKLVFFTSPMVFDSKVKIEYFFFAVNRN